MIFRKDRHRGEKIKDDHGDVVIIHFHLSIRAVPEKAAFRSKSSTDMLLFG
jgi:hypothetical protein